MTNEIQTVRVATADDCRKLRPGTLIEPEWVNPKWWPHLLVHVSRAGVVSTANSSLTAFAALVRLCAITDERANPAAPKAKSPPSNPESIFFSSAQMSDPDPSAADDIFRINNLILLALRSPAHSPVHGAMEKLAANLTQLRDDAAKARRRSPEHRELYETLCLAAGQAQGTAQATEELLALLDKAHAAARALLGSDQ